MRVDSTSPVCGVGVLVAKTDGKKSNNQNLSPLSRLRLRLRHGLRARSLENVPLATDHCGPDLHTLSNPH